MALQWYMGVFIVHDPEWVQRDQRTSWPSAKGSKISFSVTRSILIYSESPHLNLSKHERRKSSMASVALVTSSMSPGWYL